MALSSKKSTVGDALSLMQSVGWLTKEESSSEAVHTLQSRTGEQTIILVGSPNSPIYGEVVDRIQDRAESSAGSESEDADNGED